MPEHASHHRKKLVSLDAKRWKYGAEGLHIAGAQGRFVNRTVLSRVGEPIASPVQPAVPCPGLGEHRHAPRRQNAMQFADGDSDVQMMKNRIPPDAIERAVGKRKPLPIADREADANAIGVGAHFRLANVAEREIACRDVRTPAREDDRSHAMSATEVEHPFATKIAERVKRPRDPRLVMEVRVVLDAKVVSLERARPKRCLGIVKLAFALEALGQHVRTITPKAPREQREMGTWKIAAVQMDCAFADKAKNLETILTRLHEAAAQRAKLVIFPECALTGYCYESKAEALPHAEPIPGPSTLALAKECAKLGVWAVLGMLECEADARPPDGTSPLYNCAALVGPNGIAGTYRKVHLPFLGVDRFTTSGDRPFAVHDLGGLRIGMNICYDGSFPEAARCLMLLGADLIVLPTNWPTGAISTAKTLIPARALENHVYYAAVNRVGTECGFRFIGMSRILNCVGEFLAVSDDESPTILYAEIDPAKSRDKHRVFQPGKYELHRTRDRRPQWYGPIVAP